MLNSSPLLWDWIQMNYIKHGIPVYHALNTLSLWPARALKVFQKRGEYITRVVHIPSQPNKVDNFIIAVKNYLKSFRKQTLEIIRIKNARILRSLVDKKTWIVVVQG